MISPVLFLSQISHKSIVSGNPQTNRCRQRKLGFLCTQKSRSFADVLTSPFLGKGEALFNSLNDLNSLKS